MEGYSEELSASQESKDEQIESLHSESDTKLSHVYDAIPCYSEQEAQALAERLVNEETSREAQRVLITWLEDGQCNERNFSQFHYLIHLCKNRVKKLQMEEKECSDDVQKVQKSLLTKNCCILRQLDEFEKLFKALDKGKIWDNFNQNQIEEIQEWRIDSFNFKENILKSSVVIEEEESSIKNVNNKDLQTENDPDTGCKACKNLISKLNLELEESRKHRKKNSLISIVDNQKEKSDVASQCRPDEYENKMHIISLISIFLYKNPDGVNLNGIYYHLQQISELNNHLPSIGEIENLMRRCPELEESTPISSEERKWTLVSQKTLSSFHYKQ